MWLIVGLGNPDEKYQNTRHNIGFMILDHWIQNLSPSISKKKECQSQTYHIKRSEEHLILCQPLTYMNLSGFAVKAVMTYYKISLAHLLVIHDEMDLPFGKYKFQKNRGAATHNGVKHIHKQLESQDYMRLRFGIGKPPDHFAGKNYVLSPFSKEEQKKLPDIMTHLLKGVEELFKQGFDKVANQYNCL